MKIILKKRSIIEEQYESYYYDIIHSNTSEELDYEEREKILRTDSVLTRLVEEGDFKDCKVIEIPDDVKWGICENHMVKEYKQEIRRKWY